MKERIDQDERFYILTYDEDEYADILNDYDDGVYVFDYFIGYSGDVLRDHDYIAFRESYLIFTDDECKFCCTECDSEFNHEDDAIECWENCTTVEDEYE